jgi:hypothetical protein
MARLQQKRSGRRRPEVRIEIGPREMRKKSEESLAERGVPSAKWGEYRGKVEKGKSA